MALKKFCGLFCTSLLFATILFLACVQYESVEVVGPLPEIIDFNFHIKPILSDRCYQCHGPDESARKTDLRLDTEEGALNTILESGRKAIMPGKPHRSEMVERITSSDPDFQMPPSDSKLELSATEKALLTKWIDQGAEWKSHWAFTTPERPEIPDVVHDEWISNQIDAFILAKLESESWEPSPPVDKASLLRRVSFDLTGLPPTIGDLDDFLHDKSEDAYEKTVDRLLASPAYGERMTADWMDVARYADTYGYLDDQHRDTWQWRDWVIKAFNKNLPYDEFVIWQTAGDLIPNANQDQIMATCFQRLHRQNQEGGVLPEEYRVEYVADRVQTTGKAFMGLTMECARCHDHKFDPISQKEFYQMAAFFNSTLETGRAPISYASSPSMMLTDEQVEEKLQFFRQAIKRQEKLVQQQTTLLGEAFERWIDTEGKQLDPEKLIQHGLVAYYPFDRLQEGSFSNRVNPRLPGRAVAFDSDSLIITGVRGNGIYLNKKNRVIMGKEVAAFDRTDPFSFNLWVQLARNYEDASIFDNCEHKWHAYHGYELRIKNGQLLFRLSHNYPQNVIQVESVDVLPVNHWLNLTVTYDGSSRADGITLYLDGEEINVEEVRDNLTKSIAHQEGNPGILMQYRGLNLGVRDNDPTMLDGQLDEFRIYDRLLTKTEISHLSDRGVTLEKILSNPMAHRDEMLDLYREHYHKPGNQELEKLKTLRERENSFVSDISEIMVLGDQPTPRPTFLLNRGRYDQPGEEVQHGTPVQVFPFPDDLPRNRLGLARWLTHPENPLTARVAVNRLWQICFGKGLVRTPEDFGSQGSLPSHPGLLDWLAIEFIESGWDVKAMMKMMVLSSTYQQSSDFRQDLAVEDPENILWAKSERYRLPAEMIRDQALSVSGLLTNTIGGPSFKPYQPQGLWAEKAFQQWAKYEQDTGADLYRRTMYIYWKRNTPHPYMTTFDIPDRAACTVQRHTTKTPMQALMLLNYPQFPEAARALAERMLKEGGIELDDRLRFAFRLLTNYPPGDAQLELLRDLYKNEKNRFTLDPQAALEFLNVGEYRIDIQFDPIEVAALTVAAHTIMNTVNSYTRR